MAKNKNKLTKEEKLAKDRLRKKLKYEEMKSDPERYRLYQEKEKKRYLEKKAKKKVVGIQELSLRAKREQRRRWRKNSLNYLKKKKKQRTIQRILLENSPPASDNELINIEQEPEAIACIADPLQVASTSTQQSEQNAPNLEKGEKTCMCKRGIRKMRYRHMKTVKELKEELSKVQKENKKLQLDRKRQQTKTVNEDTLEKKVNNMIRDIKEDKIDQVKKKLLFSETVARGFCDKYKNTNKKDKRAVAEEILKKKDKLSKYRILSKMPFSFKTKIGELNQDRVIAQKKLRVKKFFEEDINSQIAPGKNEYIKRGGIRKQKRYLTDNIKNLHVKYCKQWGYIGYSTFCKYRPFWTVQPDGKRDTCQCKLHANVKLLAKSLKTAQIINEGSTTDLLTSLCCNIDDQKCLERLCESCNKKVIHYKEFDNSKLITYFEWISGKQSYAGRDGKEKFKNVVTKMKKEDNPKIIINKLNSIMTIFFKHTRNIIVQDVALKELKKNLSPNEIICHVDFSENYCMKYHEEIQSFHFGGSRGQVSLHTGVMYYLNEQLNHTTKSFCSMSQCLNHDASAIWAHLSPVLGLAKKLVPQLTKLHFVSDSPSNQYRNRFIFVMIAKFQNQVSSLEEITWNYLEAGHGKSAPDGIGAVIKRAADEHVKYGGDAGTFETFVEIVKDKVNKVDIMIVPEEEIMKKKFPINVPGFKGTIKVHQVVWSSDLPYCVAFRTLSCFTCRGSYVPCQHSKHLGVLNMGIGDMTVTSGLNAFNSIGYEDTLTTVISRETDDIESQQIRLSGDENQPDYVGKFSRLGKKSDIDSVRKNQNDIPVNNIVNTAPSNMDSQVGNLSPLQIDSPTIFNNIGNLLDNTDLNDSIIEEDMINLPHNVGIRSNLGVKILSNVPYSYQRFTLRDSSIGFNSTDQTEFERFINSSNNSNNPDDLENKRPSNDKDSEWEVKYDIDMWVVVKYKLKNTSQYYIGKIIEKYHSTKEYTVIFLRKGRGALFSWPQVEDEDIVAESCIINKLDNPKENRRGQFSFENLPNVNYK